MRKKLFITMIIALVSIASATAQANKAAQIAQIRQAYAEAKERVAANGQDGNGPLDVTVTFNTANEVNEDMVIEEGREIRFFFVNKRKVTSQGDFYDQAECYFITVNWGANGHTVYSEMLFDDSTGRLIFSFDKSETHAGFVVENRYYYDTAGRLIERKVKAGGEETDDSENLYGSVENNRKTAQKYLSLFNMIMDHSKVPPTIAKSSGKTTPKAARMEMIRSNYTDAWKKVEAEKNGNNQGMHIVIHDQDDGESPPVTTQLNFYFREWDDGQAPMYRCYFITYLSECMYYRHNTEYLFDDGPQSLLFSYTRAQEEGEQWEWRYYYDENGGCIETRSNHEDTDAGKADKFSARRYLGIFHAVANPDYTFRSSWE